MVYKGKSKLDFAKTVIRPDILEYGENKSYIIIKQKINKKYFINDLEDCLEIFYKYNENMECFKEIVFNQKIKNELDSLMIINKKDSNESYKTETKKILDKNILFKKYFINNINYYIIDKINDLVIGPLDKVKYQTLKKQKKITLEFGEVPFFLRYCKKKEC